MSRRPLALAYHGVAEVAAADDPMRLFVSPSELRKHIGLLRRWGYDLVPFTRFAEALLAGRAENLAALTFDDGFDDNLHELVPVLRECGVPATVFVVSGWLGRDHPDAPAARIVDADELRSLHAAGVEIGAHTATHPDLSTLAFERQVEELRDSRLALEELTGAPVTIAAYPYGNAGPRTPEAARAAGLRFACSTWGRGSQLDPFLIPREDMGNRSSALGLRLKRDGRYETLMRLKPLRGLRRARYAMVGR